MAPPCHCGTQETQLLAFRAFCLTVPWRTFYGPCFKPSDQASKLPLGARAIEGVLWPRKKLAKLGSPLQVTSMGTQRKLSTISTPIDRIADFALQDRITFFKFPCINSSLSCLPTCKGGFAARRAWCRSRILRANGEHTPHRSLIADATTRVSGFSEIQVRRFCQ